MGLFRRAGLTQAPAVRARIIWMGIGAAAVIGGGGVWWWSARHAPRLGQTALAQTEAILALGPRPPGSAALQAVREHLRCQLQAAGWVCVGQPFERSTTQGALRFENLRARFAGGDAAVWQRPVNGLLCAHMDSKRFKDEVFVGADDAASACGAMLEIARALALANPQQAKLMELVFFDGEEALDQNINAFDGLYGSRFYASAWPGGLAKPQFGILLDMIGHRNLAIRLPSDTPDVLREVVLAAAGKQGVSKHFGMAAGPIIDDHTPLTRAGIPMVDIIGDFSNLSWWHTPADNRRILSADSLDISIRVTLDALDKLLRQP
ncbi:MAG: M28 family peptidase [Verrucomicrobia bacterium]|nr:MAG: M28 family peptidase [Verrucomicrobiota bacterium]